MSTPSTRFVPALMTLVATIGLAPVSAIAQDDVISTERDVGVFVSQVGNANAVDARQGSSDSDARIVQDGSENSAELDQGVAGNHFADVTQRGDRNSLVAAQNGNGQAALFLSQLGDENSAVTAQSDGGDVFSAATVLQSGNSNSLILQQDGSDNQARLTQNGDGNTMSATQLNSGNRLEWTQDGSGLSDLQVTQEGGQTMFIQQTNTGGSD